jgi:hypothetical protein
MSDSDSDEAGEPCAAPLRAPLGVLRAYDARKPHLKDAAAFRAAASRNPQLYGMRFPSAPPPPLSVSAPPDPSDYERREDDGYVWAPELHCKESLPDGLPCAHCGRVGGVRRLQLAAPSSPRRVRDRVGDTWLFFGLYICTCSDATFNSLERVLRRLPERVLERLPCLLTTKSGLSRRFVDDVVDALLRNSGFEEAARLRRSEQQRLHTEAQLAYLLDVEAQRQLQQRRAAGGRAAPAPHAGSAARLHAVSQRG